VGSSERVRQAGGIRPAQAPTIGDGEAERARAGREGGGREEVADRAVRRVDVRAAVRGVRFDVRYGVGTGGVESGVRDRRDPRQRELQEGRE